MPCSGCSPLLGVNPNQKKKKSHNQYCQYVIAPPTNSQTVLPTSWNHLQTHSHLSSVTTNISYNSLNPSHFLLMIPSHEPTQLALSQPLHTISLKCVIHSTIFPLRQPFSQFRLRQCLKEQRSLVRTDSFDFSLISEAWTG